MAIENYKLDIGGLHGGSFNMISLHFAVDNDTADPNYQLAQDLLTDFHTDKLTAYRALCPDEYAVRWIRAKRVSTGGGMSRTREYPTAAAAGTRSGSTGSLALSPVIKLYPGMGSNTQGRIFFPVVMEGDLANNVIDTDLNDDLVAFFAGLIGWNGSTSDWTYDLTIRSRKLATFTPVVAVSVSAIIGNQKRRRSPT